MRRPEGEAMTEPKVVHEYEAVGTKIRVTEEDGQHLRWMLIKGEWHPDPTGDADELARLAAELEKERELHAATLRESRKRAARVQELESLEYRGCRNAALEEAVEAVDRYMIKSNASVSWSRLAQDIRALKEKP